ncbi:MAG: hypothetical protein J6Q78_02065 [Clostridia bacterium]|nr:hypothetical protein [Clostridia bacterium]
MKASKKKIGDIFLLLVTLSIFLFFSIGIWFNTSPRFSENDNRHLAEPPLISSTPYFFASLWNGTLPSGISSFYNDRLPLRSQLLTLRSRCELLLGKREVNGIIQDSSGVLYQIPAADTSLLDKNLNYITDFSKKMDSVSLPTTLLCIPDRLTITDDDSLSIITYKERAQAARTLLNSAEDLPLIDLYSSLKTAHDVGEYVYFSTDHHLTSYGAYLAYKEYVLGIGLSPIPESNLSPIVMSDCFLGSSHSRFCTSHGVVPDTLTLLRYHGDENYELTFCDTGETNSSFYDLSAIDKKDKYSVFLGGNYGRITVSRGSGRQKLLVIKDSYANAMLPFLALHFDLDVIDLRYYPGELSALIEKGGYDRVLMVYGINTLSTDLSPRRLSPAKVSS